MKRIFVPTDFSPTAEKAFHFAVSLASKMGGEVVLYHMYTPVESTFIDTEEKRRMYNIQMEKNALKRLQRLRKKVAGASCPVPVETIVGRSPLLDNILGYVERHAIDLIVMGTQGASGLKKVIIGSEASRIAEESDIPVLLVPEKFEWKEPEKIVFATDYALSELSALGLTIELAKAYKAGLQVVHLFAPADSGKTQDKEMAAFETFAGLLQQSFRHFPLQFRPVASTAIRETMEHLHQEIPYDLLVMVRRDRSFPQQLFLKSFTKAMCYVTRCPLLVVPAGYTPAGEQRRLAATGSGQMKHQV